MASSDLPAPYPISFKIMAGMGPIPEEGAVRIAAPVGVRSSPSIPVEYVGFSLTSSAVTGGLYW